jgi:hypothetical protein
MTARARATALALVNWKGVFYERYLLDRHPASKYRRIWGDARKAALSSQPLEAGI